MPHGRFDCVVLCDMLPGPDCGWPSNTFTHPRRPNHPYLRWTPHPVIVTIMDNKDHIRVLLYSYYTTITGWGVLLTHTYSYQGLDLNSVRSILINNATYLCSQQVPASTIQRSDRTHEERFLVVEPRKVIFLI